MYTSVYAYCLQYTSIPFSCACIPQVRGLIFPFSEKFSVFCWLCRESYVQSGGEYQIYKSLPKQTFKGSSYFHPHLPGYQVWPIPETFRGNQRKLDIFWLFPLLAQDSTFLWSAKSVITCTSAFQLPAFLPLFFFLVVYVFFFYSPLTVFL